MKKIISLLTFGLILSKAFAQVSVPNLPIVRYPSSPIVRDSDLCINNKHDSVGSSATVGRQTCIIYMKDLKAYCNTGTAFADTNFVNTQYLAAVASGSHDTSNGAQTMVISPNAGTIANLGVCTPANPKNMQTFTLIITQNVTSLVFSGRTSTLVTGSVSAGYFGTWEWLSILNAWIKRG